MQEGSGVGVPEGVSANGNGGDLASVKALINSASKPLKFFTEEYHEDKVSGSTSAGLLKFQCLKPTQFPNKENWNLVEVEVEMWMFSGNGDLSKKEGHDESNGSAYSSAPHKIPCPYCPRKFPWTSSLKRHILTHTGQKPYKVSWELLHSK